jgi:hypothetical protein
VGQYGGDNADCNPFEYWRCSRPDRGRCYEPDIAHIGPDKRERRIMLTRHERVAFVHDALDRGRYVEVRGDAGVGKSGVLKHFAGDRRIVCRDRRFRRLGLSSSLALRHSRWAESPIRRRTSWSRPPPLMNPCNFPGLFARMVHF